MQTPSTQMIAHYSVNLIPVYTILWIGMKIEMPQYIVYLVHFSDIYEAIDFYSAWHVSFTYN